MLYRTRRDPAIVRYGLHLYFSSRSFRLAAIDVYSIWKWVQKYADCADRLFRTDRLPVRVIFVDETLLQTDGEDYWLWIAYEPALNICLIMPLSRERTIFVRCQFFKKLRNRYTVGSLYSQMVQDGIMMHADG